MEKIGNFLKQSKHSNVALMAGVDRVKKSKYASNVVLDYGLTDKQIEIALPELLAYDEDRELCKACPGLNRCSKSARGLEIDLFFEDDELKIAYSYCEFMQEKNKRHDVLKNLIYHNVSDSHFEVDIKKYIDKSINAVKEFNNIVKHYPEQTAGLYVSGVSGSGKTSILASGLAMFLKKGYSCAYISIPSYTMELKSRMNDSSGYYELFEMAKTVQILVIDDIGIENSTYWSRDDVFARIIDARYDNNLLTFFGSNYVINDLEESLTINSKDYRERNKVSRIVNRIKQMSKEIQI